VNRRLWLYGAAAAIFALSSGVLVLCTVRQLAPPETLRPGRVVSPRIVARDGTNLSISYLDPWNVHDTVSLHEVPELLLEAFLVAEDQRFFEHRGVDWLARAHAVVQAVRAGRVVRGASTITEQTVRILNPRPRTVWSRWLEGIEAGIVERRFSKAEILECYLNQVPYASNRRGVVQAARSYFDRDLNTLSPQEMLVLAVLVRSPSRLDPARGTDEIRRPVEQLARRLRDAGILEEVELAAVVDDPPVVARPLMEVEAAHFVGYVRGDLEATAATRGGEVTPDGHVTTTLDASLQARVQAVLDRAVQDLAVRGVTDGAVLVADHRRDQILAWVGAFGFSDRPGGQIDKVTMPRQPGSTLKPLLYAVALERGWTAATLIEDAPLADSVGHGLHSYRNYSRQFYGPLRLREALGNSLNIPAVRTVRFVGHDVFLQKLRDLGFTSLSRPADFYGDGLALGNGEVTLYELVGGFAALARAGEFRPLGWRLDDGPDRHSSRQVLDSDASSIIADVLSDPQARRREFGAHSVLNLPVRTAVKTGTSNDHRDAWAVGFSDHHTVGVWMGNVDGTPTDGVSGSQGPALVLRAVFAELRRHGASDPPPISRRLRQRSVCAITGMVPGSSCPAVVEWFRQTRVPADRCAVHVGGPSESVPGAPASDRSPLLISPVQDLHLAKDPRIPDEHERFPLQLDDGARVRRTDWLVDGVLVASTGNGQDRWLWPVERGWHRVRARVWLDGSDRAMFTPEVRFLVK
jgi:penicillin-binding protein 1C